jgi:hypothetical protein
MWTLTQLPSISAPVFRSPRGLPYGLQIVARRYNDPLLLKFVAEGVAHGLLPASSFEQVYGEAASEAPSDSAPAPQAETATA